MNSRLIAIVVSLVSFSVTTNLSADPSLTVNEVTGAMTINVSGAPWILNGFQVTSDLGSLTPDPDTSAFQIPGMNLLLANNVNGYAESLFVIPAMDVTIGEGDYPLEATLTFGAQKDLEFKSTSVASGDSDWTSTIQYIPEPLGLTLLTLGIVVGAMGVRRVL